MVKRIDEFVSENRQNIKKIDATFVPISGQSNQNLTFSNNEIEIAVSIEVYTRSLNNSLISGHPDAKHGSGRGVAGDVRGSWTLETDTESSEDFVKDGRNLVRDALNGSATAFFRQTAVGTGTSTALPGDTTLDSETNREFAWAYQGGNANEAVAESIFLFSEFGDSVSEYGVYSDDDDLYDRVTTDGVNPASDEELRVETTFTVQGDGVGNSAFTDTGEEVVARTLRDSDTVIGIQGIVFGDGATSPQESDTSLDNQLFGKNAERQLGPENITAHTVVFTNEPNSQPVDIAEVGVIDNGGNLLWRIVIESFEKNEDVEFDTFVSFRIK